MASNGEVSGFWTFTSPATTSIASFAYSRYLRTYDDDRWRSESRVGSGAPLESCMVPLGEPFCTLGTVGGSSTSFTGLSTNRVQVGVRCASGSSTTFCLNGAGIHSAQATLYGATVTVDDPQDPTVGSLTGGLFGGGWLRGTLTAQLTASDATGISNLELQRDGGTSVRSTAPACDYRLAAPCPASATSSWAGVDTSTLADGVHGFTGVARDAASNVSSTAPVTVRLDNTPPVAPVGLVVQGGTWSKQPGRTLSWVLPGGQFAPVEAAQVTVCPTASGSCLNPAASTTSSALNLPAAGAYTASVKLVDAAGNVGSAGAVGVGYDATTPPAPRLGAVTATGGNGYQIGVDTSNDAGPAPVTVLAGEVCRAGGGCTSIRGLGGPPSRAAFQLPAPGTYTIAVRSIDAAGNTSPSRTASYTLKPPVQAATPTPSASPAPQRVRPLLKLSSVRLLRRKLALRGRLSASATGRVAIRVKARGREVTKRIRIRNGRFKVTLRLKVRQRGAAKARVRVAYSGDKRYKPRARTLVVKRGDG